MDDWVDRCPQPAWRKHSDAVNSRLLDRWLPASPVDRLLKTDLFDEAVSEGLYSVLADRAGRVWGIDLSHRVARAAAERYPTLGAFQADVCRLPFDDATFDAVVSISTLDHFDSASTVGEALRELNRVLVLGGALVLTLDNLSNPLVTLRNALPFGPLNRVGLVPYPMGRSFGSTAATRLVRDAGFDVTQVETIMHTPRVAAIPVVEWISTRFGGSAQRAMSRAPMAFERLEAIPTSPLTGHFVAIRALKKKRSE